VRDPYGINELNNVPQINDKICCHIKGCDTRVKKPSRNTPYSKDSLCSKHGIYVHTKTYIYQDPLRNLLWHESEDTSLFAKVTKNKRDQRFGHENSEDALTWNIFRAFHREKRLHNLVDILVPNIKPLVEPLIFYWASKENGALWEQFEQSSDHFNEESQRRTEPDIILFQPDGYLIFVEAKFGSTNERHITHLDRYREKDWFDEVFSNVPHNLYELMRHWLLGTFVANSLGIPFTLVNLVRRAKEADIEEKFWRAYCNPHSRRRFYRKEWEDIFDAVNIASLSSNVNENIKHYFNNKTLDLQPAFSL